MPTVGFIGTGIMGAPMSLNLAKAGYELTVFNRSREKAEAIASPRIRVAASAAEVAAHAEIVITCVTDSAAVEEVVIGSGKVLDALKPGSILVDMSTISPAVERGLDARLRERECQLVDAPVSGGDIGARNGTLAVMAGGTPEAFDRVLPLFQAMGRTITYCGPVGNGQLTKLCNQILVSMNLWAVSEALAFAGKNGLDPSVMIQAVQGGAAGSWQLTNLGPRIVNDDFAPGFMIDLMQKDLRLVLEAADQAQVSLPGAATVHHLFHAAQAEGAGRDGTQALARVVKRLSGLDSR